MYPVRACLSVLAVPRTNLDTARFFPFPFWWEGELYVLNGMDLAGGVCGIYRCTRWPAQWELVKAVPEATGTHSHVVSRGGQLFFFVRSGEDSCPPFLPPRRPHTAHRSFLPVALTQTTSFSPHRG